MDEHIKSVDLSSLTHAMSIAARAFVDLKFQIDTKARKSPESIPQGLYGSMRGDDFFNCVLPFCSQKWMVDEPELLYVPVTHTLGGSWRWWPDDRFINDHDERKIRDHIFSPFGIVETSYTFIPELGLFLPGEGKNRVNFCRYHNIEHIPAKVYTIIIRSRAGLIFIYSILTGRGMSGPFLITGMYKEYSIMLLRCRYSVLMAWPFYISGQDTFLGCRHYQFSGIAVPKTIFFIAQ